MAEISLLSVDRALADRLAASLGGRIPINLIQAIEPRGSTPNLIVVDGSAIPPDRSISAAVAAMVESANGRPVVLAIENRDADLVLKAVRAGAADVIDRGAEGVEVSQVLTRLLNTMVANHSSSGQLTLVLGADPEAAAIFATDLAIARANGRPGHLLIDCTMPTSAAEAYLDVHADYGIASAIADIDRLDSVLLSNALARHEASGLMLLTLDGGTGSEPAGIAPPDIAGLIQLLRATCQDVILCAGSLRHSGLLRELAASADGIELVCTQSIRELDAARRLVDKLGLDGVTLRRTRLVVWDHDPAVLLDGRRMIDALGLGSFANVPIDMAQLRNANNSGKPLALDSKDSGYLQALRRIGDLRGPVRSPATMQFDRLRKAVTRVVERYA
jgi:pilus assembly protein CpaE